MRISPTLTVGVGRVGTHSSLGIQFRPQVSQTIKDIKGHIEEVVDRSVVGRRHLRLSARVDVTQTRTRRAVAYLEQQAARLDAVHSSRLEQLIRGVAALDQHEKTKKNDDDDNNNESKSKSTAATEVSAELRDAVMSQTRSVVIRRHNAKVRLVNGLAAGNQSARNGARRVSKSGVDVTENRSLRQLLLPRAGASGGKVSRKGKHPSNATKITRGTLDFLSYIARSELESTTSVGSKNNRKQVPTLSITSNLPSDLNMFIGNLSYTAKNDIAASIYERFRSQVFGETDLLPSLESTDTTVRGLFPDETSWQLFRTISRQGSRDKFQDGKQVEMDTFGPSGWSHFYVKFVPKLYSTDGGEAVAMADVCEFSLDKEPSHHSWLRSIFDTSNSKTKSSGGFGSGYGGFKIRVPLGIQINSRLVDDYIRLRDAVAHEMCHVAEVVFLQRRQLDYVARTIADSKTDLTSDELDLIVNSPLAHSSHFSRLVTKFVERTADQPVVAVSSIRPRPRCIVVVGHQSKMKLSWARFHLATMLPHGGRRFPVFTDRRYGSYRVPFRRFTFMDSFRRQSCLRSKQVYHSSL